MLMQQMTEAVSKEKEAIRTIIEKLPYTHLSLEGWDGNATDRKIQLSCMGMNCINHVWHVVPAPLYVLPASAMTLKTMIQAMA